MNTYVESKRKLYTKSEYDHSKVQAAHAQGCKVERQRNDNGRWMLSEDPAWFADSKYRALIKATIHSGIAFTSNERREAVKLLRGAKHLIETRQEKYICIALAYAEGTESSILSHTTWKQLCEVIDERLSGEAFYESWMWTHHNDLMNMSRRQGHEQHTANMRTARLQWIDALIKEFSE